MRTNRSVSVSGKISHSNYEYFNNTLNTRRMIDDRQKVDALTMMMITTTTRAVILIVHRGSDVVSYSIFLRLFSRNSPPRHRYFDERVLLLFIDGSLLHYGVMRRKEDRESESEATRGDGRRQNDENRRTQKKKQERGGVRY